YLRGVPWVSVPSTLLAQVDAGLGGKTGANLRAGKNLVGAFHQPRLVVCDPVLLTTLPSRERWSGLAEVVKCALLEGGDLLQRCERDLERLRIADGRTLDSGQRQAALEAMGRDKKARRGAVRFVLLERIGAPVLREASAEDCARALAAALA